MTAFGNDTYSWDVRNRLIALSRTGANPVTASFAYDYRNRRTSKTINGTATTFQCDEDRVVSEITNGSRTATLQGPWIDTPISRGNLYYTPNQVGSTTTLTDSTGSIVEQYAYAPYGETVASQGVDNPLRFTNREDDGTGLVYYRARYYAPPWGRFISEDPIAFAAGMNQYAYAGNNPVGFTDPFGLEPVPGNQVPIGPDGIVYKPPRRGLAPLDKNGEPIELHHRDQNPDGPIDEMTPEQHRQQDHSRRGTGVDHGPAWQQWRRRYWEDMYDSGRFNGLPEWRPSISIPQLPPALDLSRLPRWTPVYDPPLQEDFSIYWPLLGWVLGKLPLSFPAAERPPVPVGAH